MAIGGVGERRAEDVGPEFLPVVEQFRDKINSEQPRGSSLTAARLRPFFEKGMELGEISAEVDLAESTVSGYLAEWVSDTCPESISTWVDVETAKKIEAAIERCGVGSLRPVYDALGEKVSYDKIRIVMGLARARREVAAV